MAKRGRPTIDPTVKLNERIELRLSDSEKKEFKAASALSGMPMTTWMRDRLMRIARKELRKIRS